MDKFSSSAYRQTHTHTDTHTDSSKVVMNSMGVGHSLTFITHWGLGGPFIQDSGELCLCVRVADHRIVRYVESAAQEHCRLPPHLKS